jgi:hypothetical protein
MVWFVVTPLVYKDESEASRLDGALSDVCGPSSERSGEDAGAQGEAGGAGDGNRVVEISTREHSGALWEHSGAPGSTREHSGSTRGDGGALGDDGGALWEHSGAPGSTREHSGGTRHAILVCASTKWRAWRGSAARILGTIWLCQRGESKTGVSAMISMEGSGKAPEEIPNIPTQTAHVEASVKPPLNRQHYSQCGEMLTEGGGHRQGVDIDKISEDSGYHLRYTRDSRGVGGNMQCHRRGPTGGAPPSAPRLGNACNTFRSRPYIPT